MLKPRVNAFRLHSGFLSTFNDSTDFVAFSDKIQRQNLNVCTTWALMFIALKKANRVADTQTAPDFRREIFDERQMIAIEFVG